MTKIEPLPGPEESRRLQRAFKVIIVLGTIAAVLLLVVLWLGLRPAARATPGGFILQAGAGDNLIRKKFPDVDFSAIYLGMSATDIDRLQRDCLAVRYVYAPFVEFAPVPVAGRFVNILPAGFRKSRADAPWPPVKGDVNVFVFGGSTTFGFGLPDDLTPASALEQALAARYPGRTVRCYNFGRRYYFSTQERLLLESLLARGRVPDIAVFIDGLNDFAYADGVPQLTPELYRYTAPDLPQRPRTEPVGEGERADAVERVIARYQHNIRLTEGIAQAYGVTVIFVGQPVPFLDFPMTASTYPFPSTFAEHRLAGWGYGRFREAAKDGRFGERFVWCGNAFGDAKAIMYADSIHYNAAGSTALAQCIVDRAAEVGLLP